MQYLLFPVLRHGVLLLMLLWLALGCYYRAEIFSKTAWETPGSAETSLVAGSSREAVGRGRDITAGPAVAPEAADFANAANAKTEKPAGERQADSVPSEAKPTSVPAFMRVLRPTEPESPPVWKMPAPSTAKRVPLSSMPAPGKTRPVEAAPPHVEAKPLKAADRIAPRPPSTAVEPKQASKPAMPSRQDGDTEQTWLARARKAYWEGRKEAAEAYYRQGLARFPQSADLAGELGNIVFEEGRYAEAIDYLTQAEQRLRSAGRDAEAANLVSIIALIKRKIAEKQAAAN